MAVWRSPSSDGFTAFATFSHRARLIDGPVAAGARVVMVDSDLISLPMLEADIGLPFN